ncbi:hypothetical protein [Streptomyces celluloflavus]|uniref:hypothetical protein n=1 Tax=Streptomyces celluloflavus TaxID=58344 RepID=UPI0036A562E1
MKSARLAAGIAPALLVLGAPLLRPATDQAATTQTITARTATAQLAGPCEDLRYDDRLPRDDCWGEEQETPHPTGTSAPG